MGASGISLSNSGKSSNASCRKGESHCTLYTSEAYVRYHLYPGKSRHCPRGAQKQEPRGVDVDRILALAEERKHASQAVSDINKKRNEAAAARDGEAGRRLKDELKAAEEKYQALEKELVALLIRPAEHPLRRHARGPGRERQQGTARVGREAAIRIRAEMRIGTSAATSALSTAKRPRRCPARGSPI